MTVSVSFLQRTGNEDTFIQRESVGPSVYQIWHKLMEAFSLQTPKAAQWLGECAVERVQVLHTVTQEDVKGQNASLPVQINPNSITLREGDVYLTASYCALQ